jgi:amidase
MPDDRDPATRTNRDKVFSDYTQFLDPNGLAGARIGVARAGVTGYSEETDEVYEAAIKAIRAAGATVVDPADIPTINDPNAGSAEITVLVFEFRRDLNAYLATRTGVAITSLAKAIEFNEADDVELRWFLQEWFEEAERQPFTEAEYLAARDTARRLGGPDGIDAALAQFDLDALVAPTGSPAWTTDLVNGDHFLGASSGPAAIAGYPLISVPAGDSFGLPVGLTFMGTAYSEPTLIKLASGFEAATRARRKPQFLPTLPTGPKSGGHHRHHSSRRQFGTNASPAEGRPMHVHL